MKEFISSKIRIILPTILVILGVIISLKNYTPNTWLTGWDNLHPEFNLALNIGRSISAVWQEYQGLGLLGGMAHAADLPRQLFLLFLSVIVPSSFLRYLWTYLMLILGPLGVYFLVNQLLIDKFHRGRHIVYFSAFVAGIYYLLNLATVQTFYNPYETFVSFYGMFPWLLVSLLAYLKKPTKKTILIYAFSLIVSSPAFYVQTLFVVYLIALFIFLIDTVFVYKGNSFKRVVFVLITTFISTFYWFFPTVVFSLQNIGVVRESKINSVATPEVSLMNNGFSTINDLSLLKGFWFEYSDYSLDGKKYQYLYEPWRSYLSQSAIVSIGYLLFAAILIGTLALLFSKNLYGRSISILFLLSCFLLLGGKLPIPLFEQMFRSVYTKWSLVSALTYSVGIGYFLVFIGRSAKKPTFVTVVFGIVILFANLIFSKPVFDGHLISSSMRIAIPQEYFSLYNYFQKEPKQKRIAYLPIHSFWGWNFYSWGYRGSGFMWYGIEQPILDRAFDVWSQEDETFYHEYITAFSEGDRTELENVLRKYDVGYVIIDENIIIPGQDNISKLFKSTHEKIISLGAKKTYQEGKLTVYEMPGVKNTFVTSPVTYSDATGNTLFTRKDSIYPENPNYLETNNSNSFPFTDIYEEKVQQVSYREGIDGFTRIALSQKISGQNNKDLFVPPLKPNTTRFLNATITYKDKTVNISFEDLYRFSIDNETVGTIDLPKLTFYTQRVYENLIIYIGDTAFDISNDGISKVKNLPVVLDKNLEVFLFDGSQEKSIPLENEFLSSNFQKCWNREGTDGFVNSSRYDDSFAVTTRDAAGCISMKIGSFPKGALVTVKQEYKSTNGSRPHFCFLVEGSNECLHDDIFYHSYPSEKFGEVIRNIKTEANTNYWLVVTARPSNNINEVWTINYKAPNVSYYPFAGKVTFDRSIFSETINSHKFSLPKSEGLLEVSVSSNMIPVNFTAEKDANLRNCDVFRRGSIQKVIEEGKITYTSRDRAATCDYTLPFRVNTLNDYLLRIKGANLSGRSLKYYIFNKASERNSLEGLTTKGVFDDTLSLLSTKEYTQNEYVVNLEVRSLGGEKAESTISGFWFYPITSSDISRVFVTNITESKRHFNNINISSVKKYGTYLYEVNYVESNEKSLITLSQGYNRGWIYYQFPFTITNSLRVKGWANGFLIEKPGNGGLIVYLPQIIEYIGFLMIFLYWGYAVVDKRRVKK